MSTDKFESHRIRVQSKCSKLDDRLLIEFVVVGVNLLNLLKTRSVIVKYLFYSTLLY